MKYGFLLLFVASLAFAGTPSKGCGPDNQGWVVQVKTLPDFSIAPDTERSTIVFLNRGEIGIYQLKLAVDGQWRAATKRNSYAAFQVLPGEHNVCAAAFNHIQAWIPLKTEAGRTYFITDSAPMLGKAALEILAEDNAKAQMASLKVSLSHPKN